ncbi:Protocadherin Fat 4 [Fragariocoptes setiger]|uniref:Protocadherin Fat 4 n=1 Tax=Fragariocoptes setiger TaxID=1670756 RepID=A0ABQ7S6K8_9ACAR|nr:Protocadherin Fat 4 [Fragariocoptes setiger]
MSSMNLATFESTIALDSVASFITNGSPSALAQQLTQQSKTLANNDGQRSDDNSNSKSHTKRSEHRLELGGQFSRHHSDGHQQRRAIDSLVPIKLAPGTKDIVLHRLLDKESTEGEQNIIVGVKCRPIARGNAQLIKEAAGEVTIPVRIIITDANDHAPEFLGAPFTVNISETAPLGTVVARDLIAHDADSAGPHSTLEYHVADSASPLQFVNSFEPTLVLVAPLDYETLPSFEMAIVASDQGEPQHTTSATVHVNVLDFDDQNPRFSNERYTINMDAHDDTPLGQPLQVLPRPLYAEDGDRGIRAPLEYSFEDALTVDTNSLTGKNSTQSGLPRASEYLHLDAMSGEIRLIREWPHNWHAPVTLVVRAQQLDNRDRCTLTTLTLVRSLNTNVELGSTIIPTLSTSTSTLASVATMRHSKASRTGSLPESTENKLELIFDSSAYSAFVYENSSISDTIVRVSAHFNQPPNLKNMARVNYQLLEEQNLFAINGLGEIHVKTALDYEKAQRHVFRVLATHHKVSDIVDVTVNVLNINDNEPKFSLEKYIFYLSETRLNHQADGTIIVGQVHVTDADADDSLTLLLAGQHAHLFSINPRGTLSVAKHIASRGLNVSQCHLSAVASDTDARHTTSATILVHVAPSLMGKPLGLAPNEGKLLPVVTTSASTTTAGSRRSPTATMMASVQHIIHTVLFEAPRSALILALVLVLLLVTLIVLIITMTIRSFRRRKCPSRQHRVAPLDSANGTSAQRMLTSSGSSSSSSCMGSSAASSPSTSYTGDSGGNVSLNGAQTQRLKRHQQQQQTLNDRKQPTPANVYVNYPASNHSSLANHPNDIASNLRLETKNTDPWPVCDYSILANVRRTAKTKSPACDDSLNISGHYNVQRPDMDGNNTCERNGQNKNANKCEQDDDEDDGGFRRYSTLGSVRGRRSMDRNINNQSMALAQTQTQTSAQDGTASVSLMAMIRQQGARKQASTISNGDASNDIGNASRVSVIKWPQGSIPRRVKKLTWDDEEDELAFTRISDAQHHRYVSQFEAAKNNQRLRSVMSPNLVGVSVDADDCDDDTNNDDHLRRLGGSTIMVHANQTRPLEPSDYSNQDRQTNHLQVALPSTIAPTDGKHCDSNEHSTLPDTAKKSSPHDSYYYTNGQTTIKRGPKYHQRNDLHVQVQLEHQHRKLAALAASRLPDVTVYF